MNNCRPLFAKLNCIETIKDGQQGLVLNRHGAKLFKTVLLKSGSDVSHGEMMMRFCYSQS